MNVLFKEISPDHSVMAGSCHSLTLDYFWTKLNWKVCSSHNQVSIQSTAPDQRQYNTKHPETQAALSSAPTRFPVQPMAQEGWNSSSSGTNLTGRGPKGYERFSTSAKRPLQRERPPGCRQHVPGPYSEHPCCCPNSKCCLNTCCFWVGMIPQHTLNPKNTRRNRASENTHTPRESVQTPILLQRAPVACCSCLTPWILTAGSGTLATSGKLCQRLHFVVVQHLAWQLTPQTTTTEL